MGAVGLMKDQDPAGDEPRPVSQMWKPAGVGACTRTGKRGGEPATLGPLISPSFPFSIIPSLIASAGGL